MQHNIFDSSGIHASGECPTSLLGSQSIGHTQGLACSGLSLNGLPLFPHFAPPSHTRDNRYTLQSAKSIGIMDAHESHDLWRFHGGYHP